MEVRWEHLRQYTQPVRDLAKHGASEIPNAAGDLLVVWLEALWNDGYGLQSGDTGIISYVCEASANVCRKLESRALQTEFDEGQKTPSQAAKTMRFRPLDEDYQSIEFEDREYALTPTQSTIIHTLHKAHLEKRGSVGIKEIQKTLGVNSGKMSGWFRDKKNKHLYGRLIIQTASRNHYRLDL